MALVSLLGNGGLFHLLDYYPKVYALSAQQMMGCKSTIAFYGHLKFVTNSILLQVEPLSLYCSDVA